MRAGDVAAEMAVENCQPICAASVADVGGMAQAQSMSSETENPHSVHAWTLATKAIDVDMAGDKAEACRLWQMSSDYADEHLTGETIYHWIKSGLGSALFEIGDYEGAISVSALALDGCSGMKQPLPALIMAKSYLKLGDRESAARYVQRAYDLKGDAVLNLLDPADRGEMRSRLQRRG